MTAKADNAQKDLTGDLSPYGIRIIKDTVVGDVYEITDMKKYFDAIRVNTTVKTAPFRVPSKETLAAINRLKSGKGITLSLREFILKLREVFHESKYEKALANFVTFHRRADITKMEESGTLGLLGSSFILTEKSSRIWDKANIRVDVRFFDMLKNKKKKLTPSQYEIFASNVLILNLDAADPGMSLEEINNSPALNGYHSHILPEDPLKGYWAFVVKPDPNEVQSIICLFVKEKGELKLCNVGEHNIVYNIEGDLRRPSTLLKTEPGERMKKIDFATLDVETLLSLMKSQENEAPLRKEVIEALRASLIKNHDLYRELAK